jgi:transposase
MKDSRFLTKDEIDDIRYLRNSGVLCRDIAKRFKVSQSTVCWWTNESYRLKELSRMKQIKILEKVNHKL